MHAKAELNLLVRHAPDGSVTVVEPPKLQTDVRLARAIAILGELTSFVLANAQSPESYDPFSSRHPPTGHMGWKHLQHVFDV